jgi:hypothetical protein
MQLLGMLWPLEEPSDCGTLAQYHRRILFISTAALSSFAATSLSRISSTLGMPIGSFIKAEISRPWRGASPGRPFPFGGSKNGSIGGDIDLIQSRKHLMQGRSYSIFTADMAAQKDSGGFRLHLGRPSPMEAIRAAFKRNQLANNHRSTLSERDLLGVTRRELNAGVYFYGCGHHRYSPIR